RAAHRLNRIVIPDLTERVRPDVAHRPCFVKNTRRCVDVAVRFNEDGPVPESRAGVPARSARRTVAGFNSFNRENVFFHANGSHTGNASPSAIKIAHLVKRLLKTNHLERYQDVRFSLQLSCEKPFDIRNRSVKGVDAMY